jgi:hypothetical protein
VLVAEGGLVGGVAEALHDLLGAGAGARRQGAGEVSEVVAVDLGDGDLGAGLLRGVLPDVRREWAALLALGIRRAGPMEERRSGPGRSTSMSHLKETFRKRPGAGRPRETVVGPAGVTQQELESRLWAAANSLRGPVDPSDFKAYIFPLLFYKRISDTWDAEHAAAETRWGDQLDGEIEADYHRFTIY